MTKRLPSWMFFIGLGLVVSGCTPTAYTMMIDPALSDYYGRECRVSNALDNQPICPEHVVMVQERELYCKRTLANVECYASDPREHPLYTDNTISPLVADEVEILDPDIPEPREIASGRDAVEGIEILRYPPRAIGTGIPVMNTPR